MPAAIRKTNKHDSTLHTARQHTVKRREVRAVSIITDRQSPPKRVSSEQETHIIRAFHNSPTRQKLLLEEEIAFPSL